MIRVVSCGHGTTVFVTLTGAGISFNDLGAVFSAVPKPTLPLFLVTDTGVSIPSCDLPRPPPLYPYLSINLVANFVLCSSHSAKLWFLKCSSCCCLSVVFDVVTAAVVVVVVVAAAVVVVVVVAAAVADVAVVFAVVVSVVVSVVFAVVFGTVFVVV